jgi:hypothetical protein
VQLFYIHHRLLIMIRISSIVGFAFLSAVGAYCSQDIYYADPTTSGPSERTFRGHAGAWGELQFTRIAIGCPDEYLDVDTTGTFDFGTWVFRNFSRPQVEELFANVGLTTQEHESILRHTKWMEGPGATVVFPDRNFILNMNAGPRQAIYDALARYEENPVQRRVFLFHPETLAEQFFNSGVGDETIARFRKLLYPKGNLLVFADLAPLITSLATAEQKRNFYKAISRKITMLMKLNVAPNSDVDALLDYWDYSGRPKELRPLLESLKRVPEGAYIDIAHLLPGFARKHLYTFPRPDDSNPIDHNCHWSAFNFFNDPPDERLCDIAFIQKTAFNDYDKVTTGPRFGDIIVLSDGVGNALHSSVWVADGIVFTKNGSGRSEPWLLMPLRDVMGFYAAMEAPDQEFTTAIFRKRFRETPAKL